MVAKRKSARQIKKEAKRKKRIKLFFKFFLVFLFFSGLVAGFGYLANQDFAQIKNVELNSDLSEEENKKIKTLAEQTLEGKAFFIPNSFLLFYNTEKLEKLLKDETTAKKIVCKIDYKNKTLKITAEKFNPKFFVCFKENCMIADDEGILFKSATSSALLKIEANSELKKGERFLPENKLENFFAFLENYPEKPFLVKLNEISANFYFKDFYAKVSLLEDGEKSAETLMFAKEKIKDPEYIDLRILNKLFYKTKNQTNQKEKETEKRE